MLNIIRNILLEQIDKIDSGNSVITLQEQLELLLCLQTVFRLDISRTEAAHQLNVSVSTFNNRVSEGKLPQGLKRSGFKELSWNKYEILPSLRVL